MKINDTFNTPVLLIVFNRPAHTRKLFAEIKRQKPKHLYIFQDGARQDNELDKEKCAEVRAIFAEPLDWDCELKTYFADNNLGCGRGPAAGITWFFGQVEQGIIFEDDVVPSETIFTFYEELLNTYKDNSLITMITGTNLKLRWKSNDKSYIFSAVGAATPKGSWASWRRAWDLFDYDILAWKTDIARRKIAQNLKGKKYYKYWANIFDTYSGTNQKHVWDYQWFFSRTLHNTISIVSSVNQVSNIGYGIESTHTTYAKERIANQPVYNIKFPLIHPEIEIDRMFDWVIFNRFFYPKKKSVFIRLILKILESIYCR